MPLKWLNAPEAVEAGTALADEFLLHTASASSRTRQKSMPQAAQPGEIERFLQRLEHRARSLKLNTFRKAKLANSFKWRLLEKGVERQIADELTQAVVVRLATHQASPGKILAAPAGRSTPRNAQALLVKGNEYMSRGARAEAMECYREFLSLNPRHAIAHNNLGAALLKLGHYGEAEHRFRSAIGIRANYADAHGNLGAVLRLRGRIAESEMPLRRALKLKPAYVEAQVSLGNTLLLLGRLQDAKGLLEKALKVAPRHVDALVLVGRIAGLEGRLAEAEAIFKRALEIEPRTTSAWAALVRLRRMTSADDAWLKGAEAAAANMNTPLEEANIRFALGKYFDDIADFRRAFRSYQRANELQKTTANAYDRKGREHFVDDLIRVYTREALARERAVVTDSSRPVFVTGMMRSGTTLVAQIIHSHSAAKSAGELQYWPDAMRKHEDEVRREILGDARRRELATAHLRVLDGHCPDPDAVRVVDKTTFNSDYLGIIHSVFPNARMIYLRRDPIDTCLSCYFQPLSSAHEFALDLSDLAHYYREHHRLVAHWRSVLPAGTLLEVPYAELVADQEGWTRKILAFLGLEWDERCLDFHTMERPVLTASYWQVRQKIYQSSVSRWRNYEKFIGPLLSLRNLT
jgi:tetratricopeptide (TPR) repeat protein